MGEFPTAEAIDQGLALLREDLGAASVNLVYGAADGFGHFGSDPFELPDTALWLIHRQLSTFDGACSLRLAGERVSDFRDLRARSRRECVAALIPTRRNAAQMLVACGAWARGLSASRGDLVESAAPALALLLERRLNLAAAEEQQYQLGALVSVGRTIAEGADLEKMLTGVARTVAVIAGADYVSIDILGSEGRVDLRCVSYGQPQLDQEGRWSRAKTRQDPVREAVLASCQPMIFVDAQNDDRIPDAGRRFFKQTLIRSAAVFPLQTENEPVGVLSVASHRPRTFAPPERRLLQGIADQIATAVSSAQQHAQRMAAEEALRKSEAKYRSIFENVRDIFFQTDLAGTIVEVSPSVRRYGYSREELLGTSVLDIYEAAESRTAFVQELLSGKEVTDYEMRLKTAAGEVRDGAVSARLMRDAEGAAVGLEGMLRDITQRKQSEHELRRSEQRFRSLVQNASDLITVVDADATILYQSPAIERVLGYDATGMLGKKLWDVLLPADVLPVRAFIAGLAQRRRTEIEARFRHRDGSPRYLEIIGADRRGDPGVAGFVLNARDVTERKLLEEQLRHQAFHDPLTGLANRARFGDRLEHSLLRSKRTGRLVAVLFMDLDDFKSVNDVLGHTAGDHLLVAVAKRVEGCLRAGDTVARFGGDEFVVLLEDLRTTREAVRVAERITESLQAPFEWQGKEVYVRASIGIAVRRRDHGGADELLRNADVAMYVAKGRGKGCYEVHDPSMHVATIGQLELVGELQRALDNDEFVLYYQPVVRLRTGEVVGVEALVRWRHPERGLLLPGDFIPLAEQSGAILRLGRFVLGEACCQAQEWQDRFPGDPPLTMSVNVSAAQLQHRQLVDYVAQALHGSGLDPHSLILEITESAMMQDVKATTDVLGALKNLGVRLAIDDFGTGYSSLGHLRQFPFDILKIDKSLIGDASHLNGERDLTRVIIDMGRTLELETVAEGIEHVDQLGRLLTLECYLGQGFYFTEPIDPDKMERFLGTARARLA